MLLKRSKGNAANLNGKQELKRQNFIIFQKKFTF
jgi:hypothetical protein